MTQTSNCYGPRSFNRCHHAAAASNDDRELHDLLDAAIDLPAGQLAAFLEDAASSPELALEAEGLLRDPGSHDDFLSPLLPGIVSWTAAHAATTSATI